MSMTYRQLLLELNSLSDKQLDSLVMVSFNDDLRQAVCFEFADEDDDILDAGYPYIGVS